MREGCLKIFHLRFESSRFVGSSALLASARNLHALSFRVPFQLVFNLASMARRLPNGLSCAFIFLLLTWRWPAQQWRGISLQFHDAGLFSSAFASSASFFLRSAHAVPSQPLPMVWLLVLQMS